MPTYTRLNLRNSIWDSSVYSNIASRIDTNTIMNEIVREVCAEIDLRSTKRKTATSPNLFDEVYDIAKPSDLKRWGLIDIIPQIGRRLDDEWTLTTPEEFDRRKAVDTLLVAIDDRDFLGKIRVSIKNNADQLVIGTLDSLLGDGSTSGVGWEAFDADTANVIADTDNFVRGSGSIRFDINAVGGTTSGIKNSSLTTFDWTDYVSMNRSVFVWAWITSATNLTNYKLRLGSSASAYDEMTVTAGSDATAFHVGWNLLRFDFSGKTTTGSPTRTAGTFAAIYMTKAGGKISETGYRFDYIVAQEGKYYDVLYYSKYGWQTSGGTYLENSTADTDLINADTDEYNLFVQNGRIRKARIEKDFNLADREEKTYQMMRANYILLYPSEAKILINQYRRF